MSTIHFQGPARRKLLSVFSLLNCIQCVVFLLLAAVTPGMAAVADQAEKQPPRNVIAVFRLDRPVTEAPLEESLFLVPATSLRDLLTRLDMAGKDPAVKAVVLVPEGASLGSAQVEEVRAVLAQIRERGKEVYIHADSLMMGQYLLACGGSRISVAPTGAVIIPGLLSSSLHVRSLLDKIGVRPDFIAEGDYKSAAELFTRQEPSPKADEMMNWLLDSAYETCKELIGKGRNADATQVQRWLDTGLFSAEQAKAAGLIDAVENHADFQAMLNEKYGKNAVFAKSYGVKKEQGVDLSSPMGLFKIWGDLFRGPQKKEPGKPAIALVYVSGPIMTGESTPNPFLANLGAFSTEIRQALEKVAADDSIKGVVLRIDSPGGSATASEIILDATKRVKDKKPLVVSMGDVAGSGGYYVACGADTIFADATTLTGSIGVVGGKLATTEMWNKIGVTFKEYKRGENAGIFSSDNVFTESERARIQSYLDEIYGVFKKHVTDIRGDRLKKSIDELAGGRVFTGKQALELGLVDRLGTLNDAIAFAAEQAKLRSYDVRVVPEPRPFLELLMEQLSGGSDEVGGVRLAVGQPSLLKMAAPYLRDLDPERTAAIMSVLTRLEILQKEGVLLTMPEIR